MTQKATGDPSLVILELKPGDERISLEKKVDSATGAFDTRGEQWLKTSRRPNSRQERGPESLAGGIMRA